MAEVHQVKCGRCNVALKGPADPKPDDIITCPVCGEADKFEAVIESVKEYIADVAAKGTYESAISVFDGVEGITVNRKEFPEKPYRFTADFTF